MCARSRMNEVSQVEIILFLKYIFWSGVINMQSCRFLLDSGKYQGLFGLAMGILARPTVSPKYKPWLDQTRPDIFPNRAKTARLHIDVA